MALTATLYAAQLQVADQDRQHYQNYSLKIALHPSEQPERMVARLLVWCLNANEKLTFGKGISSRDEAEIWQRHDHGDIEHWIDVGEPDDARVKKASRQSEKVTVFAYTRSQDTWWKKHGTAISNFANVTTLSVPWESVVTLANDITRQIHWQITISESTLYVSSGDTMFEVPVTELERG